MLDALLSQTHGDVEIIVVDDGSTDDSREVLAEYGDRIVVELQEQRGQSAACNRAFALSRGEIVVFHDSDDLVYPDAAARLVESFADPAVTMVLGRLDVVDAEGRVSGAHRPPDGCPLWGGDLRPLLLERCSFFWPETTGQAYRRSVVEAAMPIPDLTAPDFYFSYRGALAGRVVALVRPLACYRAHGLNKSLMPLPQGVSWLEHRIEQREQLHEMIRTRGRALGVFDDPEAADAWAPRDYILASLCAARGRLRRAPGRWARAADGVRAIVGHPQFRVAGQARHVAWFVGLAVLPRPLALRSIAHRFPLAR
ncbi:MAG: hypothetical protein QOD92_1908 [Acidimicrobiaceae bacterium]